MIRRLRLLFLFAALAALPAGAGMGITGANTPHVHSDANTGGGSIFPARVEVQAQGCTDPDAGLIVTHAVDSCAIAAGQAGARLYLHTYAPTPTTSAGVAIVRYHTGSDATTGKRWGLRKKVNAESGSNAGSDFDIESFNDTGGHLGYPITITRSTGVVTFDASPASSKACDFGARLDPNYCGAIAASTNVLSTAGTCVDVGGAPAGATARDYLLDVVITSAGSAAARSLSVGFYSDSGCTSVVDSYFFAGYEFSAVADGTAIFRTASDVHIVGAARYAKIIAETGGTGTTATVYKNGYFD